MTDFFKNNPMALRHCILYEYLRENPVERSFTAFCMTIGPEVIEKEEFQVWFDQFNQGIFDMEDGKEPMKDMKDVLRSDKYALRACILYESLSFKMLHRMLNNLSIHNLRNNPSFSMYNSFCKVIGDDVMEYREFDFWFYRFLNGNVDLKFERDKDKKTYELMDMPVDVMKEIMDYLDIFDRANLVRTSRSLQTFVKDQKLFHHTLELTVAIHWTYFSIGKSINIEYLGNNAGCKKHFKNNFITVRGVQHWKQAVLDLTSVLKTPKLHLNTLAIESGIENRNVFDDLEDALEFTHFINVKELILKVYSSDLLVKILTTSKPGYLTTINIFLRNPNVGSMEEVFEMEQWKQAKHFKMDGACFIWPLRNLYHFKKFHVGLKELSVEDIREIKEVLFKSSEFEKCVLNTSNSKFICEQEFGNALREDPHIYHYAIPNSTDYFEIKVGRWTLKAQRQKS